MCRSRHAGRSTMKARGQISPSHSNAAKFTTESYVARTWGQLDWCDLRFLVELTQSLYLSVTGG